MRGNLAGERNSETAVSKVCISQPAPEKNLCSFARFIIILTSQDVPSPASISRQNPVIARTHPLPARLPVLLRVGGRLLRVLRGRLRLGEVHLAVAVLGEEVYKGELGRGGDGVRVYRRETAREWQVLPSRKHGRSCPILGQSDRNWCAGEGRRYARMTQ